MTHKKYSVINIFHLSLRLTSPVANNLCLVCWGASYRELQRFEKIDRATVEAYRVGEEVKMVMGSRGL